MFKQRVCVRVFKKKKKVSSNLMIHTGIYSFTTVGQSVTFLIVSLHDYFGEMHYIDITQQTALS